MGAGKAVFQVSRYSADIKPCVLIDCSKTSLMDPRFGPAWIAFAHTFALEGEHDHAVTAYSTCARMFTGCVCLLYYTTTVNNVRAVHIFL